MITQENFEREYVDPIEQQQIDKFVCDEFNRQIHRYIKAMHGSKKMMDEFIEKLSRLSVPEKEQAIARYIDLNRKVLDGFDLKLVLARAIANYCDTFQYMLHMMNDNRRLIYYYLRMKQKYIQFHRVIEEDGKYGLADHRGKVILHPQYDFIRTCYTLVADMQMMPVIVQKDGKMGLVLPDGNDTVVAPFIYDDISLRDEYPYFEATENHKKVLLNLAL